MSFIRHIDDSELYKQNNIVFYLNKISKKQQGQTLQMLQKHLSIWFR